MTKVWPLLGGVYRKHHVVYLRYLRFFQPVPRIAWVSLLYCAGQLLIAHTFLTADTGRQPVRLGPAAEQLHPQADAAVPRRPGRRRKGEPGLAAT